MVQKSLAKIVTGDDIYIFIPSVSDFRRLVHQIVSIRQLYDGAILMQ